MLHLQPRLHSAQVRRSALGAVGPDLERITRFGAILPEPLLDHNNQSLFYLRKLRKDSEQSINTQPYFVEKLLADLHEQSIVQTDRRTQQTLTDAERRASALLQATEAILQPIEYAPNAIGHGFRSNALGAQPNTARLDQYASDANHATRADMFHTGLDHSDRVARLLETHLIDPIREDSLAPDDPFVQTTLYVIAPLYEPLAASLIWPTVAQLMARLGRRNISQVVGLFSMGSYADDVSRAVENAASYAGLAELEVLSGLRSTPMGRAELTNQIAERNPQLTSEIGEMLFDNIYLIDREKSNQGLAENGHELAILAANALESLIVANGSFFVQEQLGIGLHSIDYYSGEKHPYSLIGTSNDYVPVTEILHAVNRQEGRRLAHQWALEATQANTEFTQNATSDTAAGSSAPYTTITDLGFSEPNALGQLVLRLPELFDAKSPSTVADLQVQERFILPKSVAENLRTVDPSEWNEHFEGNLAEVERVFELVAGRDAIDKALGIDGPRSTVAGSVSRDAYPNGSAQRAEWSEPNTKFLGTIMEQAQDQLLDILAVSPAGLSRAGRQIEHWLREIEQQRREHRTHVQSIATSTSPELMQARDDLGLRDWRGQYEQALKRVPSRRVLLYLALGLSAFVALILLGYRLLIDKSLMLNLMNDSIWIGGFLIITVAVCMGIYRNRQIQIRRLQRARVKLVQAQMNATLQLESSYGLMRLYEKLAERFHYLSRILSDAEDELSNWQDEDLDENGNVVSPLEKVVPHRYVSYLRQPMVNNMLWDRCCEYLRRKQESYSGQDAERLEDLWSTAEWSGELKRLLAMDPQQRVDAPVLRMDGQPTARSIADLIRLTVSQTKMSVDIESDGPAQAELVRELAQDFSLEHLLWRGRAQAQAFNRYLKGMNVDLERPKEEQVSEWSTNLAEVRSKHQYAESAWSRAKPTANYDVVDRLATRGSTVDFAAASGDPESDLTRAMLDEFNVTLLPTEDPFSITFVRTVHGLGLADLNSVQRYRTELRYLSPEERALVYLADDPDDYIYQTQDPNERLTSVLPDGHS